MKKGILAACFMALTLGATAQTFKEWFKQDKTQLEYLRKQIVKLQLYLGYLKKGYRIVDGGLTIIGDIKTGDFKLHEDFFERRERASPLVKNWPGTVALKENYQQIRNTIKHYTPLLQDAESFNHAERRFFGKLLEAVQAGAEKTYEELFRLLSDGSFDMNDAERLRRLERMSHTINEHHRLLLSFCKSAAVQRLQRKQAAAEVKKLQKQY